MNSSCVHLRTLESNMIQHAELSHVNVLIGNSIEIFLICAQENTKSSENRCICRTVCATFVHLHKSCLIIYISHQILQNETNNSIPSQMSQVTANAIILPAQQVYQVVEATLT